MIEKLKEIREKYQISQRELATMLGVTQKTISNWECGKKLPQSKVKKIEQLYNDCMQIGKTTIKLPELKPELEYTTDYPELLRRAIKMFKERICEQDRQIQEMDQQIASRDQQNQTLLGMLAERDKMISRLMDMLENRDKNVPEPKNNNQ